MIPSCPRSVGSTFEVLRRSRAHRAEIHCRKERACARGSLLTGVHRIACLSLSLTLASQENGEPDYTDVSRTENTRVSYPIYHIANYEPSGMGGHPKSIVFLTCDAFGVLPPVSRLSPGQVGLKTSRVSGSLQA